MTTEQPEALRLADMIKRYNAGVMSQAICEDYIKAADELRRQHARIAELESELEAVGAGGVSGPRPGQGRGDQ